MNTQGKWIVKPTFFTFFLFVSISNCSIIRASFFIVLWSNLNNSTFNSLSQILAPSSVTGKCSTLSYGTNTTHKLPICCCLCTLSSTMSFRAVRLNTVWVLAHEKPYMTLMVVFSLFKPRRFLSHRRTA